MNGLVDAAKHLEKAARTLRKISQTTDPQKRLGALRSALDDVHTAAASIQSAIEGGNHES